MTTSDDPRCEYIKNTNLSTLPRAQPSSYAGPKMISDFRPIYQSHLYRMSVRGLEYPPHCIRVYIYLSSTYLSA
jgi:hypothetical protein